MSDSGGVLAVGAVRPGLDQTLPPFPPSLPALPVPARISRTLVEALAFLFLFLATRSFLFGNPVVHIDEQFYLFVAERMREIGRASCRERV